MHPDREERDLRGEASSAASLARDQARLDELREFADPANLLLAADLRRRQQQLDARLRQPHQRPPRRVERRQILVEAGRPAPVAALALAAAGEGPERILPDVAPLAPLAPLVAVPVTARPRLIIADDDPLVLSILEGSLRHAFEVVGVAVDGEDVVELATTHHPDAALVDLEMPKGGGMSAVKGIVQVSPETAIVVLSSDEEDRVVRELMRAGAVAYRRKGIAEGALAASLTGAINVLRGQPGVALGC